EICPQQSCVNGSPPRSSRICSGSRPRRGASVSSTPHRPEMRTSDRSKMNVLMPVAIVYFLQRQKMITSRGQNEKPSCAGRDSLLAMKITQEQRDLYKEEGYMILPGVINGEMLEMLREECSYYLGYYDSIMDAKGVQSEGISHRGKRYFINNRYRLSN